MRTLLVLSPVTVGFLALLGFSLPADDGVVFLALAMAALALTIALTGWLVMRQQTKYALPGTYFIHPGKTPRSSVDVPSQRVIRPAIYRIDLRRLTSDMLDHFQKATHPDGPAERYRDQEHVPATRQHWMPA